MCSTRARVVVSRQNNDVKHRICSTKEKLDYYAKAIDARTLQKSMMPYHCFNYCSPFPTLKLYWVSVSVPVFDTGLWRTSDIMNHVTLFRHMRLRFFTMVRRCSCGPTDCWILARTSLLVTWSLYEMCSILLSHRCHQESGGW